jgi:GNAT superfamily N-acetyltransferase
MLSNMSERPRFENPVQFNREEESVVAIPAAWSGNDHVLSIHADGGRTVKGRIDINPKSGTINSIHVMPSFRRQGVATRLVEEARSLSEQFDGVMAPTIEGSYLTDRGRDFFREMEGRGVLPTNLADRLPRAGNDGQGNYRD